MIDVHSESGLRSLRDAIRASERTLIPFWERRRDLIEKTVGDNWGVEKRQTLLNMLWSAIDTYSYKLSVSRPRVVIESHEPQATHFAIQFALALNNYVKTINIDDELQEIVKDALFGMGIAKVFWAPSEEALELRNPDMPMEPDADATEDEIEAYRDAQMRIPEWLTVDPGRAMIERVPPEDYVYDTTAARRRYLRYECHRFRIPLNEARLESRWDVDVVKQLRATSKYGDTFNDRAEALSKRGAEHDPDELEPHVTLWDVWLPKEKKWIVMPDQPGLGVLHSQKWNGAPGGPFRVLHFGTVPDNIAPITLAGNLDSLHDLVNTLLRKAANQAKRQKKNTVYSANERDARAFRDAKDGEEIGLAVPSAISERSTGGVDPGNMQFAGILQQFFNKQAGNLELIAGLGAQSRTATQDQMLKGSSSELEAKRLERVAAFTGECFEGLGWMLWHDPVQVVRGTRQVEGTDITVDATWRPDYRVGNYNDYQFSYEPFSRQYEGPSEKLARLHQIVQFYLPLLPIAAQQGVTLDLGELLEIDATLSNSPWLRKVLKQDPGLKQIANMEGMSAFGGSMKMGGPKVYQHEHSTPSPVDDGGGDQWAQLAAAQGGGATV